MSALPRLVGAVVLVLATAFLALEVNLRLGPGMTEIWNPLRGFHEADEVLGWRGKENIRRRFRTDVLDVVVEHDERGFRRPEPPRPENAGRRLLILGDSLGWGWGVEQGKLFSDRLQEAWGEGVAVFNRSVNAYSTGQEYLLLQQELARESFEDILVVVSRTDFDENGGGHTYRPFFEVGESGLRVRNQPPPRPLKSDLEDWLDDRSRALQFLSWQAASFSRWLDEVRPEREEEERVPRVGITVRLIEEMVGRARRHGARIHFAYASTDLATVSTPPELELARVVREAAEHAGGFFVDLNPPILRAQQRGGHPTIPGDGHWSGPGHRIVAQTLLAHFAETSGPGGRVDRQAAPPPLAASPTVAAKSDPRPVIE
jgi:hypothetical protein